MLARIVLGFELVIVLLATLVVWGLAPPPFAGRGSLSQGIPVDTVLIAGAGLILLLIVTIRALPRGWAYLMGWLIQALLILAGFFNPALFIIGTLFGGMWWYCLVAGARIDHTNKGEKL